MIENDILRWLVGVVGIAIIVGTVVSYLWYAFLCWLFRTDRKVPVMIKRPLEQSGQLTGIVERVFFTVAIAVGMGGTAIAMIAWITVKNLILWPGSTRNGPTTEGTVSLLTSIGSMLVAIVAAEICKGNLL